jgi:hypothetical protein
MRNVHLSDEELLRELDGELGPLRSRSARAHLAGCWTCRARRAEIEKSIADFIGEYQESFDGGDRARARLQARLAAAAMEPLRPAFASKAVAALAIAACAAIAVGIFALRPHARDVVVSIPDARLTPGATFRASRREVCSEPSVDNKAVPLALQRKVFDEYGIAGARSDAYEVDYLVTPALGGADDIRNLWPHSYSKTVWNAHVKDALERRMREMVCDGSLDLAAAQDEIARDWIGAYKKYFHTESPLASHEQ